MKTVPQKQSVQERHRACPLAQNSVTTWSLSGPGSANDDCAHFGHAYWSVMALDSFKAPTRISREKYAQASCRGLFSERCNANGTRLQSRAAYSTTRSHPERTSVKGAFLQQHRPPSAHLQGNAIKNNLFLAWKIFPLPLSGGGESKQEGAAWRIEFQACKPWLGRVSGQRVVGSGSSSRSCQTRLFVNWKENRAARVLVWQTCGIGASQ